LAQRGEGHSSRVDRTFLAEGHHLFGERPDRFRLGEGGFDSLMLDQAANLVREQRFAMLGFAAESHRFLLMSHRSMVR
jgi:hypothetical protein